MHVFLATFKGKNPIAHILFLHNLWSLTLVYYSKCKFSYVQLPLCIIDKTAQTLHLAALVLAAVILPGHRKPTSYRRTLPMPGLVRLICFYMYAVWMFVWLMLVSLLQILQLTEVSIPHAVQDILHTSHPRAVVEERGSWGGLGHSSGGGVTRALHHWLSPSIWTLVSCKVK